MQIETDTPGLNGRLLVLYDGYCGFCNRSVRWLLRRDGYDRLRFAPSDRPEFAGLLTRHGYDVRGPGTILVVEDAGEIGERVLGRSNAVIAMLKVLPGIWPFVGAVLGWVPRWLRDFGYGIIAAIRYRLAGRYAVCPVPTAAERRHFL